MSGEWDKARKLAVLGRMMIIRRFEERLVHLFEAREFTAHYHLYIGQEATGAAVMEDSGPATSWPRRTAITAMCWQGVPIRAAPWPKFCAAKPGSMAAMAAPFISRIPISAF
jgi:TPP-dependent pyruvate/acetoin dehydrogenase alpha subunit